MKTIFGFTVVSLVLMGCGQSVAPANDQQKTNTVVAARAENGSAHLNPQDVFTLADAEKIMGEPAHLKESSNSIKGDTGTYQSVYIANKSSGEKTGAIYFMLEQYAQVPAAHDVYAGIKKANENHGIKTLDSLGDEAYFHTDNENFYFIMARKGTKMIRIKVNKLTPATSREQFDQVAKNIMAQL